jgi:hypothetical protein
LSLRSNPGLTLANAFGVNDNSERHGAGCAGYFQTMVMVRRANENAEGVG